jgi:hypothetical protein
MAVNLERRSLSRVGLLRTWRRLTEGPGTKSRSDRSSASEAGWLRACGLTTATEGSEDLFKGESVELELAVDLSFLLFPRKGIVRGRSGKRLCCYP